MYLYSLLEMLRKVFHNFLGDDKLDINSCVEEFENISQLLGLGWSEEINLSKAYMSVCQTIH